MRNSKLFHWKVAAGCCPLFDVQAGVDLSVSPASVRASFPYPSLPPYRVLAEEDIIKELVAVPRVETTATVSLLAGIAMWVVSVGRLPRGEGGWLRLARLALALVIGILLRRFVNTRRPSVLGPVSKYEDVSSNPKGVCCVSSRVVCVTNSHAGTHADQPPHFHPTHGSSRTGSYPKEHYTGLCTVVDVSELIQEQHQAASDEEKESGKSLGITTKVIEMAVERYRLDLQEVWRLLFVTTTCDPDKGQDGSAWVSKFSYFCPDAVSFLAKAAPKLMMVGLDTPSVDHPSCSPLHENSHGRLFANDIAIVENLCYGALHNTLLANNNVVEGSLLTVFNPMNCFPDSRGCQVIFFPKPASAQ